jgi:hypothetical protein
MAAFIGFLVFAALLILMMWVGYRLGREDEQDELEFERNELDPGWIALEQARQINDVFFQARAALRQAERDALRHE